MYQLIKTMSDGTEQVRGTWVDARRAHAVLRLLRELCSAPARGKPWDMAYRVEPELPVIKPLPLSPRASEASEQWPGPLDAKRGISAGTRAILVRVNKARASMGHRLIVLT